MSLFNNIPAQESKNNLSITEQKSNWSITRQQVVIDLLKKQGSYEILQPTENELKLSDGIYVSGDFSDIDKVNDTLINSIGEKELNNLNKSLKTFIDGLELVASENKGIYDLMDDLFETVDTKEMKTIWDKAVNAKPNLLETIIGIFNSKYKKKALLNKVSQSASIVEKKGKLVGAKIDKIENDLLLQKSIQINNINKLNQTFDIYYHAVKDLRIQYILMVYIQYNYKLSLDSFIKKNVDNKSIDFIKKQSEYQRVSTQIDSKCLLIQQSLMHILIAVKNNDNLIKVCHNLLFEINNTIIHSLPNIRTNVVTLAIALRAEKGLKENNSVRDLEKQQSLLTQQILGDLSVKSEELAGTNALKGAETMKELVDQAEKFQLDILSAKENKKKDIDSAFKIMYDAQYKFNDLLKEGV